MRDLCTAPAPRALVQSCLCQSTVISKCVIKIPENNKENSSAALPALRSCRVHRIRPTILRRAHNQRAPSSSSPPAWCDGVGTAVKQNPQPPEQGKQQHPTQTCREHPALPVKQPRVHPGTGEHSLCAHPLQKQRFHEHCSRSQGQKEKQPATYWSSRAGQRDRKGSETIPSSGSSKPENTGEARTSGAAPHMWLSTTNLITHSPHPPQL